MTISGDDDRFPGDDARPDPTHGPSGPGPGRRVVLLAGAPAADRDMYGGLLWYNGYEVVHADDGEGTIAAALEHHPDLVLLDLALAGELDGPTVVRRIRGAGLVIPVLALSADPPAPPEHGQPPDSSTDADAAALEAGVTAVLRKPVDPFAVVRQVIHRIGYAHPDANGA